MIGGAGGTMPLLRALMRDGGAGAELGAAGADPLPRRTGASGVEGRGKRAEAGAMMGTAALSPARTLASPTSRSTGSLCG